jgi:hypothetical protein
MMMTMTTRFVLCVSSAKAEKGLQAYAHPMLCWTAVRVNGEAIARWRSSFNHSGTCKPFAEKCQAAPEALKATTGGKEGLVILSPGR